MKSNGEAAEQCTFMNIEQLFYNNEQLFHNNEHRFIGAG